MEASWVRGGTSKGLFFNEDTFPFPRGSAERDAVVRQCLGFGGNGLQLDGMGGGISSTSKVAFVGKSSAPRGFDLTYDFGQVNNNTGEIDWKGSCGNLASAVVLFARGEPGMLAHPNRAKVWQVNVQQEITVTHQPDNTLTLAGLNSESEAILVEFAPDETRGLLPTGNVVDLLCGGAVRATLVLGSNPTVVVPMEHLAGPHDLERLRSEGASRMKVPCNDAVRVAFVSTATPGAGCDLRVQITVPPGSARTFHHAITGTGAANLAVASLIPGTVCHVPRPAGSQLTIAHPSGAMQIGARVKHTQQVGWCSLGVSLVRTARVLMRGRVFG